MARPPHEDPEYQRQIVGTYRQGLLSMSSQQQQQQQHQPQQHHGQPPHPQQQQQQHHHQHHQQMNAAIKPPLPAATGHPQQQPPPLHHQHHQSLNNNNSSSSNNNTIGSNSNGSTGSSNSSNGSGAVHPHSNTSPLIHHNYTWSQVSPTSPQKHVRLSPRPSASYPYPSPNYSNQIAQQHHYQQQQQQQQHLSQIQLSPGSTNYHHQTPIGLSSGAAAGGQVQPLNGAGPFVAPGTSPGTAATNRSPLSPNRRTRGENKKCRKVYGMDHKDQWCTQCKWKKACSRFGD